MSVSHKKKASEKLCLSIKQWALCLALVLLVISIVFTVCATLAKIHTDIAWDRLKADIEEEMEKNYSQDTFSPNEAKLDESRQIVYIYKWIVFIGMTIGILNVGSLSVTIYGIVFDVPSAMMPWLVIGAISYAIGGMFLFALHDHLIPGLYLDFYKLIYSLGVYLLLIPFWYIIYQHFLILRERNKKLKNLPTSKSVVGNGGYIHTFDASTQSTEKTLVV